MPRDLIDSLDELGAAFEEFKKTNDRRLADLEKKGRADPLDLEQLDRINERMDQLETVMKRHRTGAAEADPEQVERAEHWIKTTGITPERSAVETVRSYAPALEAYLRKGGKLSADQTKALSVGVDADGGYWVNPTMLDRIVTRIFESSPVRQVAMVETIGTDAVEFPNDVNDATSGGWVGETDPRAETATPQIGMVRIPVHEQFANPRATQKLLDDAQFNVEMWLAGKIADKLSRDEANAFVVGNGVSKPRGFLDYGTDAVTTGDSGRAWGVLQYVASGGASDFAASAPADPLIALVYSMKSEYRAGASWAMNRTTIGEVRKLKDGDGNYLWSVVQGPAGTIVAGQPGQMLGYPVVEMNDMPDIAANAFAIAFGAFGRGYMVVERQGVRTLRDPYSSKPYVQFYTTKRVGGDVIDFDAIKLFKIASS